MEKYLLQFLTEAGYYLRVQTDIQTETSVNEGSGLYFNYKDVS